MSAFGKVEFNQNNNSLTETVQENFDNNSVMEEQVEKFDNNYSAKLQELYSEYDKITLDEEKIRAVTQIKADVTCNKVPFRVALVMTTSIIVAVLLAFLCIYNISVINSMDNGIVYLQEEVMKSEQDLFTAKGINDNLTSAENIQIELKDMGYGEVTSSNIVSVTVPDKKEIVTLQEQTNWFDAICNFLGRIFG